MLTFEQFQATRQWSDDICAAVQSAQWGDDGAKVSGQLYLGALYIESALGIEGATGEYLLTIGRDQMFGDLESLERRLHAWAVSEGYSVLEQASPALSSDAKRIADAFRQIYAAAMVINEVLGANDALNDSVPTNWPLHLSADEFATECHAIACHYDDVSEHGRVDF